MDQLELAWHTAAQRYASCCDLGGTTQERAFAWGQARGALDTMLERDHAEQARRAKRPTLELGTAA